MGKLTISMAIFNGYVSHYQRVSTSPAEWRACGLIRIQRWPITQPLSFGVGFIQAWGISQLCNFDENPFSDKAILFSWICFLMFQILKPTMHQRVAINHSTEAFQIPISPIYKYLGFLGKFGHLNHISDHSDVNPNDPWGSSVIVPMGWVGTLW